MGCQPSKADAVTDFEEYDCVMKSSGSIGLDTKKHLERGNFHEVYELRGKLGKGAHGTVYSACGPAAGEDDSLVAVKVVDLRDPKSAPLERTRKRLGVTKEASLLRALPKSANVIEFYAAYIHEECAYFVMEKCEMGLWSAFQRMPSLTEEALRPILMDMMSGVAECHAANIAHRDIKLDNFLAVQTPSGRIVPKLCDFGLSTRVTSPDSKDLQGVCGTPPFLAPEVLSGERYSAKVDVWAMGALAHVLVFGRWPYMPLAMTVQCMKQAILTGFPGPTFEPGLGMPKVSKPCLAWVKALLNRSAAKRPSARQALLDGNLAAKWSTEGCLVETLESAWNVGAFELPVGEASLTDLDRYVAQLNVARNMRAASTGATGDSWSSDGSSSKEGFSASTGWIAADEGVSPQTTGGGRPVASPSAPALVAR